MTDQQMTDIILEAVLTVREVCHLWGKDQKSVMIAIWRDQVAARQAAPGATWLVTRASCIRLWGEPKKEMVTNG